MRTGHDLVAVAFSKDRALQLDAMLRSLHLHCRDVHRILVKVIYVASTALHEQQYRRLRTLHPSVRFIEEMHFRHQVIAEIEASPFTLLLVDDTLFVRAFVADELMASLIRHRDAVGFSLRLGRNTRHCYMNDSPQPLPARIPIEGRFLKADWTTAEHDFGYPWEVSSSIYRTGDLLPLLDAIAFTNPNSMESYMATHGRASADEQKYLLYGERSFAFSNPLNKVQTVCANRAGQQEKHSIDQLADLYRHGYRVDVRAFANFLPVACHQERELALVRATVSLP